MGCVAVAGVAADRPADGGLGGPPVGEELRDGEERLALRVDAALLVGARAAAEHLLDEAELARAAEPPRRGLRELHEVPEGRPRRPLLVALEPDQVGVEAVARRAPLVLRDERDRLRRQAVLALVALGERRGEALDEGDERGDGVDPRLRVADPDLDRAEPRVWPQVPPDVRVVGEETRGLTAADKLLELRERAQPRR